MTMLPTTFKLLAEAGACGQREGSGKGYDRLARYLGGVSEYGEDTPISLAVVARSNGLADALWCLRATREDFETVVRLFLRLYLADVLEHLGLEVDLPPKVEKLLAESVSLLRDQATSRGAFGARAVEAAEAVEAAPGVAAWVAEAVAWAIEAVAGVAEQEVPDG